MTDDRALAAPVSVCSTPAGRPIWRGNLNQFLDCPTAVEKLNKPGLHFHDLRHR